MNKQAKRKGISQGGQAKERRIVQPRHSIVIWLILAAIFIAMAIFAREFILSAAILPLLYQYWIYRGQSGKNALAVFALAYLGMSHFIQGQKAGFGTTEGLLYLAFTLIYFGGIALLLRAKAQAMQAVEAEKAAQEGKNSAAEEGIEILVEEAPDTEEEKLY